MSFLNQLIIKAIAPLQTPSLNTAGNTASTNLGLRLKKRAKQSFSKVKKYSAKRRNLVSKTIAQQC